MENTITIKDLNTAIKDYVSSYISDKAQSEGINECNIIFTCDSFQHDLPLEEIVDKIEGHVEDKIIECINEVIDFSDIVRDPDYILEEELEK